MKTAYIQLQRYILLLVAVLALGACSTAPEQQGDAIIEPSFSADTVLDNDLTYLSDGISDPWEGFNRSMYRFNYRFDKYLFLPVVNGYKTITPDFLEKGIHNFFLNLGDINTFFNSILQLNGTKTVQTTGRFLVNTTAGLLGFIDVATMVDIPKHNEDFGQTLGYWGVNNGPYLVLPLLGPSNVRDGVGRGVDWAAYTAVIDELEMKDGEEWALTIMQAIDSRANVGFRYYETGTPFEYDWVKLLYTTKRKMDIEK
ncbi:MAG: VacJ family lipoprotein [Gammaproteobacteria bacterium]|nr:MAG: VacJ family lipoprotein [Gammaproteobacteria bacterium]RLA48253.1 MAG: VacJ family lipoprotein [Gammaproteobacteria bacterium]